MFYRIVKFLFSIFQNIRKVLSWSAIAFIVGVFVILAIGKTYQNWDDDEDRGAIAIENGAFNESYSIPVYLDQGWDETDSLWFYNTTQGSAVLPYDFFLVLEEADSTERLRSNKIIDRFRFLPQKPTFFNPDGLPVGFAKDDYQGKDYMGFTCAACHTGQVNVKVPGEEMLKAIRIDGGPSMADMDGFMKALEKAMRAAQSGEKGQQFVTNVLALKNDYGSKKEVIADLDKWTARRNLYNTVNRSRVKYGYARLDAFGRIYNRVLQYAINKKQLKTALAMIIRPDEEKARLLSPGEIELVLEGADETIIQDDQFTEILRRLRSTEPGFPGLSRTHMLRVRNAIFNEPNAPVSYPFLWDIGHADYVQWNGLASNAGVGPIGRNAGEVIGVFAILDWHAKDPGFSISAKLTGQSNKKKHVNFKSSVDLTNLQRLEAHLRSLKSPQWPEDILGGIDWAKAQRGQLIYSRRCQSCHEVIDRENVDRRVIAKMMDINKVGTDPAMARNSVVYKGKSGNFMHTYQGTSVGTVIIEEEAPVKEILTSVTTGVVATPDADKFFIRRWADWIYTLFLAFSENDIKSSIKRGDYTPDTTASPYNSLLAYKARSLNGIWATAPYLHNGSVPTLYDLLLPVKSDDDPEEAVYRSTEFMVGSREFDTKKVGFKTSGYEGFEFRARRVGNLNTGHEYGRPLSDEERRRPLSDQERCRPLSDQERCRPLSDKERWELIEYLKTL